MTKREKVIVKLKELVMKSNEPEIKKIVIYLDNSPCFSVIIDFPEEIIAAVKEKIKLPKAFSILPELICLIMAWDESKKGKDTLKIIGFENFIYCPITSILEIIIKYYEKKQISLSND